MMFRPDLKFWAKFVLNLDWFLLSNTIFLDRDKKKHCPEFHGSVARYALTHSAQPIATKYKLAESAVRRSVKSFKEPQSENSNIHLDIC